MGDPRYFDRITRDDIGACVLIVIFLATLFFLPV